MCKVCKIVIRKCVKNQSKIESEAINMNEMQKIMTDLKDLIARMSTVEGSETYEDDGEVQGKVAARSRVMKFSIKTHNAEGEEVVNKELLVAISNKYKSIKRYAICEHDEDSYTSEDVLLYNKVHPEAPRQIGDHKDDHIHWVGDFGNTAQSVDMIAKWFGIPSNLVKVARGKGAFLDCVEYLTHEHENQQALGKHLYPDEKVIANFPWREELNKRHEKKLKYGRENVDLKNMLRYEVRYNGMTMKQVYDQYPFEYMDDMDKLKQLRKDYCLNRPMPTSKINMYIGGIDGGVGKGLMGKAIARNIIDPSGIMEDEEIWFKVTSDNRFNGYEGQPILIWEDFRPMDLLEFFGGNRGELFKLLEPYPTQADGRVDIKYGSTRLINQINIFDCIMEPNQWLDGLAGEYEKRDGTIVKSEDKQKAQVYRRFPITFWIVEDNYTIRVNKGILEGTREYLQYEQSERLRGNLQRLINTVGNTGTYKEISSKMVSPAIGQIEKIKTKIEGNKCEYTNTELEEMFGNWGMPITKEDDAKEEELKKLNYENQQLKDLLDMCGIGVETFVMKRMEYDDMEDEAKSKLEGSEHIIATCNPNYMKTAMRWMYEDYGEN